MRSVQVYATWVDVLLESTAFVVRVGGLLVAAAFVGWGCGWLWLSGSITHLYNYISRILQISISMMFWKILLKNVNINNT